MAQKVIVTLIDDLDGSDADETIKFGLDGINYEIDLSSDNADELRDSLAQYVEHARRIGGRKRTGGHRKARTPARPSSSTDREQNQAIRAWAREKGYEISDRGRIPSEVTEAYFKAR